MRIWASAQERCLGDGLGAGLAEGGGGGGVGVEPPAGPAAASAAAQTAMRTGRRIRTSYRRKAMRPLEAASVGAAGSTPLGCADGAVDQGGAARGRAARDPR